MARYDWNGRDRIWYGGGGLEDGDSDVEFGYSAGGLGHRNHGGRSTQRGRDVRQGGRGRGSEYAFGNWGERSGLYGRGRYDRGYAGAPDPCAPWERHPDRGAYDRDFQGGRGAWTDFGGYRGEGPGRGRGMWRGRGARW